MQCIYFELYKLFLLLLLTLNHLRAIELQKRDTALVTSPSGDYEPMRSKCSENYHLRGKISGNAKMSDLEESYINQKIQTSISKWRSYLNLIRFSKNQINLPNFAFAISGGSMRSLCLGASILDAFDERNPNSIDAKIGGLLQLANYASGLSGGAWLLGSWATSNFPRLPELNQTLWKLYQKNGLADWNTIKSYPHVYKVIKKKKKAGFPTSMVDAWGRVLSKQFIDDPNEGEGVLWSSIRQTESYKNQTYPYVIAISLSRPGSHMPVSISSPIYEYTSEDFSIWNPRLNASIPIDYLGSPSASLKENVPCTVGFDNAGFVMGLASNFFSYQDSPKHKKGFFSSLLGMFIEDDDYEGKVKYPILLKVLLKTLLLPFQDNDSDTLLMGDPGLASENIPLFPLIQPFRKLDVIIAVDSTADGKDPSRTHQRKYPNGTSLYMTYQKTLQPEYSNYKFPRIPNSLDGTFESLGFNKHPTIFGCDDDYTGPLVLYLPNYRAVADTDQESGLTTYPGELVDQFFANGFAIASQNDGPTWDSEWPQCIACLLIDKQILRLNQTRTLQCQACFDKYCAKF
ncbi:lysophospholipase [Melampsora americana]|nr:lysophospholipase [Melampsora americana]